jgi:hypothetical protein
MAFGAEPAAASAKLRRRKRPTSIGFFTGPEWPSRIAPASTNGKDVPYVSDFARWRESFVIGERHIFAGTGLITGGDARGKNLSKSARVPLAEIRDVVRFGIAEAKVDREQP